MQITRIGIVVNRLKNYGDEKVGRTAALVVDCWKQQITEQNAKKASEEVKGVTVTKEAAVPLKRKSSEDQSVPEGSTSEKRGKMHDLECEHVRMMQKMPEVRSVQSKENDPAKIFSPTSHVDLFERITGDSVRNKCISMFYSALELGAEELMDISSESIIEATQERRDREDYSTEELLESAKRLAVDMEELLFEEHSKVVCQAYRTKFRSKFLNLKEKTNPRLRQNLLRGLLSCQRFMAMTSQEMASEDLRKEMESMEKENLLKVRSAKDNSAETDMFQCGRCKQRKCKYYQLQTRSADEPMTTYVTCVNCGNRWKC